MEGESALHGVEEGVENRVFTPPHVRELQQLLRRPHQVMFYEGLLGELPFAPERVEISYAPHLLQMRGGSAHDVFSSMGILKLANGEEAAIPVVLKKHSRRERGLGEFNNNCRVIEKGIETTQPVAAILGKDVAFIASRFDENLQSGDRIQWSAVVEDQRESEIKRFLGLYATAFAELHARGVFHADPQLKNLSYGSGGRVFFFDWERAEIFEHVPMERFPEKSVEGLKFVLNSAYQDKTIREILSPTFKNSSASRPLGKILGEAWTDVEAFRRTLEEALMGRSIAPEQLPNLNGVFNSGRKMHEMQRDIRKYLKSKGVNLSKKGLNVYSHEIWDNFNELFLNVYLKRLEDYDPRFQRASPEVRTRLKLEFDKMFPQTTTHASKK